MALLAIAIASVLIAVIWYFFIAPMERQMHDRRVEMVRRKIEKREQALKAQADSDES